MGICKPSTLHRSTPQSSSRQSHETSIRLIRPIQSYSTLVARPRLTPRRSRGSRSVTRRSAFGKAMFGSPRRWGFSTSTGWKSSRSSFRGGQVATQALVSGDPPIVNIGTVVQATIQGHNVVLVAAVETKYDLIIFTRSGITQMEQLRGKRLGITGFNSATHYASIILAQAFERRLERVHADSRRPRHRAHRRREFRRARRTPTSPLRRRRWRAKPA